MALHRSGKLTAASHLYRKIIALDPGNFDALHLQGVVTAQTGDPAAGLKLMDQAIQIQPTNAVVRCNRGVTLRTLKQLDAALLSFDAAIALKSDYLDAHIHRGVVLRDLQQFAAALASYDRALALSPGHAETLLRRGHVLCELGRLADALASYDEAIAVKPEAADAYLHRGNALRDLMQLDAALVSYDKALALKADYAEAHLNRGTVLRELMRLEAAQDSYHQAITLKPDYAEAYANRATLRLLQGDFDNGWRDFEWRWSNPGGSNIRQKRHCPERLWLGEERLAGKTILLSWEMGLGDTLQFCRYADELSRQGARVLLEVQRPLTTLLADLDGVSQVVANGAEPPTFDFHCPLLSLPLALNTRIDTIPAAQGYLRADARKVVQWQRRLGSHARPRVGLVWSGNPRHSNDRYRSIALEALLAGLPTDLEYVSLQRDVREQDAQTLHARSEVVDFSGDLRDFSDTAALCRCLDLVISVDTAVAHLSGALGQLTWILLPFHPDWRWLTQRCDSPWYDSVRLFRQTRLEGWDEVLAGVREELVAWSRAERRPGRPACAL